MYHIAILFDVHDSGTLLSSLLWRVVFDLNHTFQTNNWNIELVEASTEENMTFKIKKTF